MSEGRGSGRHRIKAAIASRKLSLEDRGGSLESREQQLIAKAQLKMDSAVHLLTSFFHSEQRFCIIHPILLTLLDQTAVGVAEITEFGRADLMERVIMRRRVRSK